MALSIHLGALTTSRVISLSDTELTPVPRLQPSTVTACLEFDRVLKILISGTPNQCSTPLSTSSQTGLRATSEGTRYQQTRLVFRLYPQVTRTS